MLELRYVVEHLDEVKASLSRRSPEAVESLSQIADLARERREAITRSEAMAQELNAANQEMAKLPKGSAEFQAKRESLGVLSNRIKELQKTVDEVEAKITQILLVVPNLPDPAIPDGKSAADNRIVRSWGEKPA